MKTNGKTLMAMGHTTLHAPDLPAAVGTRRQKAERVTAYKSSGAWDGRSGLSSRAVVRVGVCRIAKTAGR